MKILVVSVLLLLASCQKSAQGALCKTDSACHSAVCVFGKCQECAVNPDCSGEHICRSGACQVAVQSGDTCVSSNECAGDMVCQRGACTESALSLQKKNCDFLETTHFELNSYELLSDDRNLISNLASCMRSQPGVKLLLEGHADIRGTVEYNLILGEKRAMSVQQYLQNSGIDGSRMRVVSYGKEKPIDLTKNEEAHAKNRRTKISNDN